MRNIVEYLEQTYRNYPEKEAFVSGENSITFAELRRRSVLCGKAISELSHYQKRMPVCVIADRDISALICMFGCLYSGNYYVLVDSSLPEARIQTMIDSVGFLGVLSCNGTRYDNSKLCFSENAEAIYFGDNGIYDLDDYVKRVITDINSFDPLYGVFTSGSTGIPKLVVKNHSAMMSFIETFTEMFNFRDTDVLGNQFPFYFDASTKDIFCCLKCGITTHIIPKEYFSFPQSLIQYLIDHQITRIIWVPSALVLVANADAFSLVGVPSKIEKVFFVGEQMPVKQLNYWKKALPNTDFINIYGSTEVAGNFLYFQYDTLLDESKRLPTGKRFPNTKVFLMNEEGKEITKAFEEGEICVVSDTLSMGYYGDMERTNMVFVQNPLVDYKEVMYKTGDLGIYDEQNNIVWTSRKDFQIKHMGYRIELSEIEISIGAIPEIEECCCVYDYKQKKIILFYQAKKDLKKEIGKCVRNLLPKYMYPSKYIKLDSIPHNANGKIDRKQLAERVLLR
jgi:amino acid adenylation domain-containing protein